MTEERIEELILETVLPAKICSVMEPENCPEEDRADIIGIEKLTTEYLQKLKATKPENRVKLASQVVVKHTIDNPFWVDASGIHQIHGYQKEEDLFTSSRESIKERVQRMLDSENMVYPDDEDDDILFKAEL